MACFPCNQFGNQEAGSPDHVRKFIQAKLEAYGAQVTVFEKIHVNGPETHPVYHFLRYNAKQTRKRTRVLSLPWNFSKFLVDQNGKVYAFYGSTTPPSGIAPDIAALLAGSVQAPPAQPPTISATDAPTGFGPYEHTPK